MEYLKKKKNQKDHVDSKTTNIYIIYILMNELKIDNRKEKSISI